MLHVDSDGSSLFELLWDLVKKLLNYDDVRTLAVVSLRCTDQGRDVAAIELDDCDEAMDVLDKDDQEDLRQAKKKAEQSRAERKQFRRACAARRAKIAAAAAKAKAKAKAAPKAGAKAAPKALARVPLPAGAATHSEAKRMMPPNAYVWRSWRNNAWLVRYPPYGSHHRSWVTHGHSEALRQALVAVWADYLSHNQLGLDACHVRGLLTD